ncbi:MAG: agmatine deiminase family protein [Acidobacteria bacterium]|nr:agmatine deiminase family protein [Acidobacteriota bacterium]
MSAQVAGARMPAEWEPHAATWLVWPHNRDDWGVRTGAVEWCYVEMIRHLVRAERVALVCQDARVRQRACSRLERSGVDMARIDLHLIATNRSWIRDSGPIFVVRGTGPRRTVLATDWRFTGWSRYRAHALDDALPRHIARRLGMKRIDLRDGAGRVVLEGGSIDVDGSGLLLTTETCLLGHAQARNPGLSREVLEQILERFLGVKQVLWLPGGDGETVLAGDDTHGHVDNVARFVGPATVLAAETDNRHDPRYPLLAANMARLRSLRTAQGRTIGVIPIRMPRPLVFDGEPLPASYLNFYIANDVVLVPTFNDPADRDALSTLANCFPEREVVGIHAVDLIVGLGAIHCVTQQQPTGHKSP